MALGQHEAAIQDYDKAIELDPALSSAFVNRGTSKMALRQHEAAIQDYDKAIEMDPRLVEAIHNRGVSKMALGQHEAAIQDYNRVLELNPSHSGAIRNGIFPRRPSAKIRPVQKLSVAIADCPVPLHPEKVLLGSA